MTEIKPEADAGRRSLLNWLLGGGLLLWLGSVLYPVGRYLIPPRLASATGATSIPGASWGHSGPGRG